MANCWLVFRTLRPPTEGLFSNARSRTASHFGSLQGRSNWERHKGPQTAELQAFSGKPGLPTWQRPAGAAPCRTVFTISEDRANCNKNQRTVASISAFTPRPWPPGADVSTRRQSTPHTPGAFPGRFPAAWPAATSPSAFVFPRWDRQTPVRGLSNDKVLVQAFPDRTQN